MIGRMNGRSGVWYGGVGVWVGWSVGRVECGRGGVWTGWSVGRVECGRGGVWVGWGRVTFRDLKMRGKTVLILI